MVALHVPSDDGRAVVETDCAVAVGATGNTVFAGGTGVVAGTLPPEQGPPWQPDPQKSVEVPQKPYLEQHRVGSHGLSMLHDPSWRMCRPLVVGSILRRVEEVHVSRDESALGPERSSDCKPRHGYRSENL